MKITYLMALLLLCGAVTMGCLNMGAENKAVSPSDRDVSTGAGYAESLYSGQIPAPESASLPPGSVAIDQKLIKTGSINLEVTAVPSTVDQLGEIALRNGGYLSSSSQSGSSSDRISATVVVRIPAAAFENTVAEIKSLGTVRSVSLNTQDVTEEYVDLQAQKEALQRQLDQYNHIMEKAESVEDILKIQVELGKAQTELDRIEGRLRYMDNRGDLATLSVYLQEPAPIGGDTGHSFITTINNGIEGFLGMIDTLIIALFTLLPLIILGVIGYGVYRWRKGRKETPAPLLPEVEKK
jgi:hypothetical protein